MEPEPANPCSTCGACCRDYTVNVYGCDVWLLAKHLRLAPERFVVARERPEALPDSFRLTPRGAPLFLALDKRGGFGKGQPCVFLMELPGALSRCAVYKARPLVCRTYPMSMWAGEVSPRPNPKCPSQPWLDATAAQPSWRVQLKRMRLQQDVYGEVNARWNAWVEASLRQVALGEYLDYILAVYERLETLNAQPGVPPQDVEDDWPGFPRGSLSSAELDAQREARPWVRYFMGARSIIDSFFPAVPPQPYALQASAGLEDGNDAGK